MSEGWEGVGWRGWGGAVMGSWFMMGEESTAKRMELTVYVLAHVCMQEQAGHKVMIGQEDRASSA